MPGKAHLIPDFTGRAVDGGRYQLTQMLGSGAYGAVYHALDHKTEDPASSHRAIKIICKVGLSDHERTNIKRELKFHGIMSKDPNVVTLHHAFEDDSYVYMVLDFVPGGNLFDKICEAGMFIRNDDMIKKAFVQILDAVEHCHRKRIFHRDLKPENILISKDGQTLYLADFGLATTQDVSHTFGCGSSFYMSPECIGEEYEYVPYSTKHADIWALGIILINMITARNPWGRAITDDDCFHDFVVDENFLLDMLPISKSANDIIKRIFELEPLDRITIPELRKAVLGIDTFFMTDAEIAVAPPNVRAAVESMDAMRETPVKRRGMPQPRVDTPAGSPANSPNATPRSSVSVRTPGSLSAAGSSDSEDSEGPLTPDGVQSVSPPFKKEPEPSYEEQDLGDISLLHETLATKLNITPRPLRVVNEPELVLV